MSSASADCEQFVLTDLLHANAGKYFRTARSNELQMSPASADGEQSVVTVSPPMGGDDAGGAIRSARATRLRGGERKPRHRRLSCD